MGPKRADEVDSVFRRSLTSYGSAAADGAWQNCWRLGTRASSRTALPDGKNSTTLLARLRASGDRFGPRPLAGRMFPKLELDTSARAERR